MPSCSAEWCIGSSTNGKKMSIFPKEPRRRKLWTDLINKHNRPNWRPTAYSYLCEAHFSAEMWEKEREDGKKKLKADAFPTIFKNQTANAEQCTEKNPDEASASKQDSMTSTSKCSQEPNEMEIDIGKESIIAEYEDVIASQGKNRATSVKFADAGELQKLRRKLRISENLRRQLISTFLSGKERRNLIIRRLKRKIKHLQDLAKLAVDVNSVDTSES